MSGFPYNDPDFLHESQRHLEEPEPSFLEMDGPFETLADEPLDFHELCDRDREDRARRGLPASRLDASLAANVHDAIDRKPSLGAMLRIADQREDERALGKLLADMGVEP
jgi:hypothetical protein